MELSQTDLLPALSDPVLESATFLNEIAARHPAAISLAAGRPYDDFFDPAELVENLHAYQEYLVTDRGLGPTEVTRQLFQYGRTAGNIHELVARTLANDEGMRVDPESIVVVTGAQEGMLITARALCHGPRDVLLVTSPCYIGMLGAAKLLGVDVVPVPEGEHGLEPNAVAQVVRTVRAEGRVPRALYLVPNFSNPSGHTLSEATRRELLALADQADLLLIEDDPYGFLAAPADRVPALKTLDTRGRVVHIGTFAKTCFPGARVGYVVADQTVRRADGSATSLADELSLIRSMITVNTSAVAQAVIGGALVRADCRLRAANAERVAFYRANLDLLLSTLDQLLPVGRRRELGISWNTPTAGFFVVVRTPFVVDDELLAISAREYGVLWTPMSYFYPDGGGGKELRVSCSATAPADLTEGVRRLVRMLTERAEHDPQAS
jgi:(S)-3,5-dihydroxyphenylglycine transaminase